MTLQSDYGLASRFAGGVEFDMLDGDRPVTVRVSDDVLAYRENRPLRRRSELLRIFDIHRTVIEHTAARKHEAKEIEPDGSVFVRLGDIQD